MDGSTRPHEGELGRAHSFGEEGRYVIIQLLVLLYISCARFEQVCAASGLAYQLLILGITLANCTGEGGTVERDSGSPIIDLTIHETRI